MITHEQCRYWDEEDELKHLKDEFVLPEGVVYLDGNSLGARPKKSLAYAQHIIQQQWGEDLINSWNKADWWGLPIRLGDKVGQLIGANAGETIISDSTTLNLFKVLSAAVKIQAEKYPDRKVIVAEKEVFPTDIYIIEGFIDLINQGYRIELINGADDLAEVLASEVAVVVLSHVNYRTGYLYDMTDINRQIHATNALVIWDLCHSVGAVAMDLNQSESDFAIGCTYKYLNGGPGSPALLWVNAKHTEKFWQPLSGWWGHKKPFDMAQHYQPADSIRRYLCGTQPIISMSLIECGLDIFLKTSMQKIRAKSLKLTDLFIALVHQECAEFGFELITPLDHHDRGSHVSYRHAHGYEIIQALIARGVIGDYREPEVLRFGVTPLYLGFEDIWQAVKQLKAIMLHNEWKNESYLVRAAVT
ncbi:kynureninase [Acinetobacter ursingii]|uniref:kynureninase n=1 Tax=Acinetobacter ursingii TaxID=108980 RepID=UPI00124EFC77|nr:kynureninase [Acinetobacter ursingii]MCU4351740.1 kynureninase [Acinetobacter ursingii]MCU4480806.1 kynureninase [Acinetobacter ursingii]MCU4505135.1 kynureninase [Acinetobacter ursingii]MDI3237035.1 kynureninase [Acinetobacter ursingii]